MNMCRRREKSRNYREIIAKAIGHWPITVSLHRRVACVSISSARQQRANEPQNALANQRSNQPRRYKNRRGSVPYFLQVSPSAWLILVINVFLVSNPIERTSIEPDGWYAPVLRTTCRRWMFLWCPTGHRWYFLWISDKKESYYYYSSLLVHDDRARCIEIFAVLNNRAIMLIDRTCWYSYKCKVVIKREFYGDGDDSLIVGGWRVSFNWSKDQRVKSNMCLEFKGCT